jgi:hypothetical protein
MAKAHKKAPDRFYPLPEALRPVAGSNDGVRWEIEDSPIRQGGRADFVNHRLEVPLGGDDISRDIRRHEMGHAQWTPHEAVGALAAKHKVSVDALQHAEDMRVNAGLRFATGTPLDAGLITAEDAKYVAESVERIGQTDPKRAFRLAAYDCVSTFGTGSWDVINKALSGTRWDKAPRIAEALWNKMAHGRRFQDRVLPFSATVDAAKYMDRVLGIMDDYFDNEGNDDDEEEQKRFAPPPPAESEEDKKKREAKERAEAARREKERQDRRDRDMKQFLDNLPAKSTAPDPKWGAMATEQPPRKRARKSKKVMKKNRAMEYGVNPKYVHRACSDGRIFGYKRKQPGGAVLIDGSGSMHITPDEVRQLVEIAPQARVAIYSGNSDDGVLRILAQDGMMVEDDQICSPAGGNNCVDGPALEWLAKQKAPLVWVSDGHVTGDSATGFSAILAMQCQAFIKKKRIRQLPSTADAITYFGKFHREKKL